MAFAPIRLYQGQPGTSATTLYTVPSGKKVILKQIHVCNVTGTDANFTLSLVPSGGSQSNNNRLFASFNVPANGVFVEDFNQVMNSRDFLSGLQSTSGAITLTISGIEVS